MHFQNIKCLIDDHKGNDEMWRKLMKETAKRLTATVATEISNNSCLTHARNNNLLHSSYVWAIGQGGQTEKISKHGGVNIILWGCFSSAETKPGSSQDKVNPAGLCQTAELLKKNKKTPSNIIMTHSTNPRQQRSDFRNRSTFRNGPVILQNCFKLVEGPKVSCGFLKHEIQSWQTFIQKE